MKTLSVALLLMATLAFVLVGCSDNPTEPVSPTDQAANQAGPLEKSFSREFTAIMQPNGIIDPGTTTYPDGKMSVRKMLQNVQFNVTFLDGGTDLLSDNGILELNATVDLVAGKGYFWGKLTLTPTAPELVPGVWKLTWHGPATRGETAWTIALKESGQIHGGRYNGTQCFFDHIITAALDFSSWSGAASGCVKTHCHH